MAKTDDTAMTRQDRPDLWTETGNSIVSLTTLATIIAVCAILYVAQDLFLPLALGMLFAFILTPVVNYLRRWASVILPPSS